MGDRRGLEATAQQMWPQDRLLSGSPAKAAGKAGPLTQGFTEMDMKVRALTRH